MKLYRSRNGLFLGVCQGLADTTGFPVKYIRISFLLLVFLTRGWLLAAYLIAAALLPVYRSGTESSNGFRTNCEDFRDDIENIIRKEYREFKESFRGKNPFKD